MLNFRKLWKPTNVGVAPLKDVYKQIQKIPSGTVLRLGGMTDCFQPIEKQLHNTYKTILFLNQRKIHYLIVTKSELVATEKYLDVFDPELAHIQVSVPTTDNEILNKTDNAGTFEQRKETIEILQENGFDVSIRLAPFLYKTADFDKINNVKVDKCLVEFLRVKPSMQKQLPFIDFNDYKLKEGGYRHLDISTKLAVIKKLKFKELSVCDDVWRHYQYFKNNINYNPEDCCNLRL